MIITQQDIKVDGHLLNCTLMNPDEGIETRAVCLFTHGQGDYSARYSDILHPYTKRGIRCICFDLRGHGKSPGKRGHVGTLSFIDAVITKSLQMAGELPYGIAGHSMGGLLTLRHLTLALAGNLPLPKFCWVNSGLLSPTQNKTKWFIAVAKVLAKILPSFTIKTGATPELCRTPIKQTNPQSTPQNQIDSKTSPDKSSSPGHQYVSIGWGVELIKTSRFVNTSLPEKSSDIPLLYTQGGNDLICPDSIAKKFFNTLKFTHKTYQLFPNMRHETFAEPDHQQLLDSIHQWLDQHSERIYHLPAPSNTPNISLINVVS